MPDFLLLATTILYIFPQGNDKRQRIVIALDHHYSWKEPRITINQGHAFWSNGNDDNNITLKLSGKYVEQCLWTPDLVFINTRHVDVFNPTPTKVDGSPNRYSLDQEGNVYVWMRDAEVTVSCTLNFAKYPFDNQAGFLSRLIL